MTNLEATFATIALYAAGMFAATIVLKFMKPKGEVIEGDDYLGILFWYVTVPVIAAFVLMDLLVRSASAIADRVDPRKELSGE